MKVMKKIGKTAALNPARHGVYTTGSGGVDANRNPKTVLLQANPKIRQAISETRIWRSSFADLILQL
jgi:RNA 3'-terminal phosphate cyclase